MRVRIETISSSIDSLSFADLLQGIAEIGGDEFFGPLLSDIKSLINNKRYKCRLLDVLDVPRCRADNRQFEGEAGKCLSMDPGFQKPGHSAACRLRKRDRNQYLNR